MAGILVERSLGDPTLRLVRGQRNPGGPRACELRGVRQRELVLQGVGVEPREPLDQVHRGRGHAPGRRPAILRPVHEARGVDHQRLALPATANGAVPLWHRARRAVAQWDDASVAEHLVDDHDVVRRLQDLVVRVVAQPEHRHAVGEAAFSRVYVDPRVTGPVHAIRNLQALPLTHRGRVRDPSIPGIDDERGAPVGHDARARVEPDLVVGAGVSARDRALDESGPVGARFEGRGLFLGEEWLLRQFGGALERGEGRAGPDALEIRVAPRRARGRLGGGSLGRQPEQRGDGDERGRVSRHLEASRSGLRSPCRDHLSV